MAYHSTSGQAANKAEFHALLKTFLTETCGWTLYDDQMAAASPYFVAYSAGESGKEDIYLEFLSSSTDRLTVKVMFGWNNTTHAAIKPVDDSNNAYMSVKDSVSFLYWIFADLDRLVVVTRVGTMYYTYYCGLIKRFWSDKVAISQGAVSAGSNVQIPVDDASIFTPGQYYLIKDNANIQRAQITAVDTSSSPKTITVASLTTGFALGAKIGEDPQPVMVGHNGMSAGSFATKLAGWDGNYYAHEYNIILSPASLTSYTDPEDRYGLVILWPIQLMAYTGSDIRGEFKEFFSVGVGAGLAEDIITVGQQTYRIFGNSGGNWYAVRES